jgi:DNA-binding HxlR family transcriptional regulator
MNERWRKMLRFGIVRRRVAGDKPPLTVEYRLTPFGRRFVRILEEVRKLQEAVDLGSVRPRQTRATFDQINQRRQDVRHSRREP